MQPSEVLSDLQGWQAVVRDALIILGPVAINAAFRRWSVKKRLRKDDAASRYENALEGKRER